MDLMVAIRLMHFSVDQLRTEVHDVKIRQDSLLRTFSVDSQSVGKQYEHRVSELTTSDSPSSPGSNEGSVNLSRGMSNHSTDECLHLGDGMRVDCFSDTVNPLSEGSGRLQVLMGGGQRPPPSVSQEPIVGSKIFKWRSKELIELPQN